MKVGDENPKVHSREPGWDYMPDSMLLQVFQYLPARDLLNGGQTCSLWNRVSYDDLLWKSLLYRDYKIDACVGILPGRFLTL